MLVAVGVFLAGVWPAFAVPSFNCTALIPVLLLPLVAFLAGGLVVLARGLLSSLPRSFLWTVASALTAFVFLLGGAGKWGLWIGLVGHSRGGEAVAVAGVFNRLPFYPDDERVAFDYGFGIRGIAAIAPVDGQYKPAGLYVHRGNHGPFNTTWGRGDSGGLGNRLLNLRPLLTKEDQEKVARVFLSAFVEAAVRGETGHRALFRDHRRGAAWLADYEEDIDLTIAAVPGARLSADNLADWKEREAALKWGSLDTRAVWLGWNREKAKATPSYALILPEPGMEAEPGRVLAFHLADAKQDPSPPLDEEKPGKAPKNAAQKDETPEPIDLTVEIEDAAGRTARLALGRFKLLQPQIEAQVTRRPGSRTRRPRSWSSTPSRYRSPPSGRRPRSWTLRGSGPSVSLRPDRQRRGRPRRPRDPLTGTVRPSRSGWRRPVASRAPRAAGPSRSRTSASRRRSRRGPSRRARAGRRGSRR